MPRKNFRLDPATLFKFPWSANNNPHGWIEVTTFCQLACPGCYRGLSLPNPTRVHEKLEKLKKDVDSLIKIRKIKVLSIAGGEPLLYPQLLDIVRYAKKQKLLVRMLTNGQSLTKIRLIELKKAGVNNVVIHVAQYQNRPGHPKHKEIDTLREKYCQIFREVQGVELSFIMTTYDHNFKQIPQILTSYKQNSDIVNHAYFTLFRDAFFKNEKNKKDTNISLADMAKTINKTYQIKPCAYLGKTRNPKGISWLFYVAILHQNRIIGHLDSKFFAKLHSIFYKNGYYYFPVDGNKIQLFKFLKLLKDPTPAKIVLSYLKSIIKNPTSILKPLRIQVLMILNTPQFTQQGWDICDGCPDAMLYQNQLVPSCLLERIKIGEDIKV